MTMTRRITPGEVLEAYRVTGLEPARGSCGRCALAAVMMREGISPRNECSGGWSDTGREWIESNFGTTYKAGFCNGFDGFQSDAAGTRYLEGYADGRAAAAAVFGEQDGNE